VYWFGDRRYVVNGIIIPFAALVTAVPLLVAGVPPELVALVPVPFAALLLGWLPHDDLAYDSTAVWMHIASGVRGVSDRVGRLVPVLLVGVPLLAVAVPVAISLHGRWAMLPALAGVCASLFLCGLGLSSISSVVSPYAVSRPGESPFQQPQRTSARGGIAQAVVMAGSLVPRRRSCGAPGSRCRETRSPRRPRCGAVWRSGSASSSWASPSARWRSSAAAGDSWSSRSRRDARGPSRARSPRVH
jgi:hypothetical protein